MEAKRKEYEKACLRTIGDGEAIASFDYELERAIANCLDPNTDPRAVRKVTLTLTLKPSYDRSQAEVSYQAKATLPADAAGTEQLYLSKTAEGPTAYVHTPRQMTFEDYEAEIENHQNQIAILAKKASEQ